jgi:8-oxo-dGTP pyrophosphatase MutT (NUDIX family)
MLEDIKKILAERKPMPIGEQRYFSVLLPLIRVEEELHVLYEVRGEHISQPGDTSFPGGAVEPGESFEETAIRETMEELNIKRDNITILGEMDYIMNERAIIHCYVGEIVGVNKDDIRFNKEVQEIFTVPLQYFMDNRPTYYSSTVRLEHPDDFPFELIPNGKDYKFRIGVHSVPFYHLEDHRLWGFTANLTDRFINLLEQNEQ